MKQISLYELPTEKYLVREGAEKNLRGGYGPILLLITNNSIWFGLSDPNLFVNSQLSVYLFVNSINRALICTDFYRK